MEKAADFLTKQSNLFKETKKHFPVGFFKWFLWGVFWGDFLGVFLEGFLGEFF